MEVKIKNIVANYSTTDRENLIPILQDVQNEIGYLPEESLAIIGGYLKLPASKIYGVATFYNQFRFAPKGKYHIEVCRGTACHVLGSKTVLEEIEKYLKIKTGETTKDKLFSLEVVACIGACGLAPVISINGEFHAKVDSAKIAQIIESYRNREE